MKSKKLVTLLLTVILVISGAGCSSKGTSSGSPGAAASGGSSQSGKADSKTLNIGVLIWKFDDTYAASVRNAENKWAQTVGKEKGYEIKLHMQNANNDQATQNDQASVLLEKGVDLLVVNLVDTTAAGTIADMAKKKNTPILFYNKEPTDSQVIKDAKSIFVGTKVEEAGIMQGDLLSDLWKKNPKFDKNGDGKCQYLMFEGEVNNAEAIARTKYSVQTCEEKGLPMDLVNHQVIVADWDSAKAQENMTANWANYGNKIEAILCNNDDMAIGVIAALNEVGYNTGSDQSKFIPIIGVDATDAAIKAIQSGKMAATVKQDGDAMGKAIIELALNGAIKKDWLDGTDYKLAEDGFSIRIPYSAVENK